VIVCVPVDPDGGVGHSWGRAARVALANVDQQRIEQWDEVPVAWDALHDASSEGGHHARVARFLQERRVQVVMAGHMGQPMRQMLTRMGIDVRLGVSGEARSAILGEMSRPLD